MIATGRISNNIGLLSRCLLRRVGSAASDSIRDRFAGSTASAVLPDDDHKRNNGRRPLPIPVNEETLLTTEGTEDADVRIAEALREHYARRTPVILRGALRLDRRNDAALRTWGDRDYLLSAVGEDTACDVEMGSTRYDDPNSLRPTIPFADYVEYVKLFELRYGTGGGDDDTATNTNGPTPDDMVYLAQNELFAGLKPDLAIPALCSDPSYGGLGHGSSYQTMFWFGPRGSTSPLHYDPLDNLLLQIVGTKQVTLFPRTARVRGEPDPDHVNWHYAGEGGGTHRQHNTSPVDVEDYDPVKHPLFQQAPPALEGVLHPGDILYVPIKWWHHMRALETSVSVNAWWR